MDPDFLASRALDSHCEEMSSFPNLGLENISNCFALAESQVDIPHQLHRRPPDSKQVLLVTDIRPEHLQAPVQCRKNTLLVPISPEFLIGNHLQIAQDMALEHGVVGRAQ
jgi:hypothetical protein